MPNLSPDKRVLKGESTGGAVHGWLSFPLFATTRRSKSG
jgi:hypothetical protein